MVMDYDMNLEYFNRQLRMDFNVKNLMTGNLIIVNKRKSNLKEYSFLGYVMEIPGKFLDQNIKFP
jgi:hypothetical protein